MKKLFSVAAIALIALFSLSAHAAKPYKELTTDELVKMKKDNKDLVIIDSRGGDWFDGVVVENAHQLSTEDTNEENLAKLAPKKDQTIVFYCVDENCPASEKAAIKASKLGYTNVYHYGGGIEGWKKAKLPTSTVAKQK